MTGSKILLRLPSIFQDGEELPLNLLGATILRIGTTNSDDESGDFVIDYQTKDQSETWRLILLFTDRGMWIECHERLLPTPDDYLESEHGRT